MRHGSTIDETTCFCGRGRRPRAVRELPRTLGAGWRANCRCCRWRSWCRSSLIALFANLIAPYDPTEPIPGAKIFEPPFWMPGGSTHCAARHRFPVPRRAEPADLRRPGVADRRRDRDHRRRQHRHRAGHPRRLSRRLGRPGDHARHRRLARFAGPGLRASFWRRWSAPACGTSSSSSGCVYWTRYARVIRGEVLEPARARVRQAGRDRRRQPRPG